MRLNQTMINLLNTLSRAMVKQTELYKEISLYYEHLNLHELATTFDTLRTVFSTMNETYVQVQRNVVEIFKPMNNQLYYEFCVLSTKLNGIKKLHEKLVDKETKLIEKKAQLFKQRDTNKWELSPKCTTPIETISSDYNQALKEILPGETNDCARVRMLFGFYCNEITEEFERTSRRNNNKLCLSIMFGTKIFRDTAKLVTCFMSFRHVVCGMN